ncbi:hypothetical protein [Streptomyces adelaidensis]|uniref:hypothetical protein n=1 Tax=Streptomyces adelaidensis TaxID=2796465 RepID=UPI0019074118|nr:hypothetical protein [Streptomyces adelaidensis]
MVFLAEHGRLDAFVTVSEADATDPRRHLPGARGEGVADFEAPATAGEGRGFHVRLTPLPGPADPDQVTGPGDRTL